MEMQEHYDEFFEVSDLFVPNAERDGVTAVLSAFFNGQKQQQEQ